VKRFGTPAFDLKLPKTVYIVGSGPSVLDHYKRIPEDAYVIALNGAINLPDLKTDLWFAHCQRNVEQEWWEETYQNHKGPKFFGSFITELGYPSDYGFDWSDLRLFRIQDGITVAGLAVQFALLLGAHNIIVVGLDMGGNVRYDGIENPKNSEEKWEKTVILFNRVMKTLKQTFPTYSIYSLGPTKLDVIQL
jgi:hypothetical protein